MWPSKIAGQGSLSHNDVMLDLIYVPLLPIVSIFPSVRCTPACVSMFFFSISNNIIIVVFQLMDDIRNDVF